ncbi:MAG: M56 family metallopeptidase [Bacteroidetes bacterium]|nr:M56 family metallopeptidase [Bacteroidota bacterium]
MSHFLIYLLQSSACMGILYGVYWIFLRKDTFHMVNRFYLVLTAFLSALVPLLKIDLASLGPVRTIMIYLDPIIITPDTIGNAAASPFNWLTIAGIVYTTGVIIFLSRFIFQLIQILLLARHYGISRTNGMNLVFVDRNYSPFSFFNIIFINAPEKKEDLQTILEHEQVHIRQMHSMDLLVVELLTIFQWFNPFVWFTNRSLKTIHEFLADQGVLKCGHKKVDYQQLLLDRTMGIQVNNLTNNFNVSLIKKRIIMMTRKNSTPTAQLKLAVVLPAFLVAVILFSGNSFNQILAQTSKQEPAKETVKPNASKQQQSSEAKTETVCREAEVQPQFPGGNEALIEFLSKNIQYPAEAKKSGIQGKVAVNFVVRSTGEVTDVKVLRGIGGGCDEEAVRVIQLMPKWTPGLIKGKPVAVGFVIPIQFRLDKDGKKEEKK